MPYIQRDKGGNISGLFENEQEGYATEYLKNTHNDVIVFIAVNEDKRVKIAGEQQELKDTVLELQTTVQANSIKLSGVRSLG